jgi:hypothetical protein
MVKVCKEEGISKSETAASGVRVPLLCLLMREFFTERYIVEFILFCVSLRRMGPEVRSIAPADNSTYSQDCRCYTTDNSKVPTPKRTIFPADNREYHS